MLRFVSAFFATLMLSYSFASVAGDCNKTVMGGGCTAEVNAGVAAHMRSQPQVKPAAKANVKPLPVAVPVNMPVNAKMTKAVSQKPQI